MKKLSDINEGVFRNSIVRTSGTGAKRRESDIDYIPVDLGLPSGTLWCDRNVGATSPEDYGGYFQWGATEDMTGKSCAPATCPYRDAKMDMFEKYNDIDKKAVLEPEDDAAHVSMGGGWHIPTFEQCNELMENTDRRPASVGGVEGMIFESRKNGNSIFIPYAGYMSSSNLHTTGEKFFVWSSSIHLGPTLAYKFSYYLSSGRKSYSNIVFDTDRYYGLSIRGVMDK